jgi:hypothetical protein
VSERRGNELGDSCFGCSRWDADGVGHWNSNCAAGRNRFAPHGKSAEATAYQTAASGVDNEGYFE